VGAIGSAPFDEEGVRTHKRDVVKNGVLQGYFLSTYSARKHMGLAMLSSTTRGETAIYASKLANLRLYEAKARLRPGKI